MIGKIFIIFLLSISSQSEPIFKTLFRVVPDYGSLVGGHSPVINSKGDIAITLSNVAEKGASVWLYTSKGANQALVYRSSNANSLSDVSFSLDDKKLIFIESTSKKNTSALSFHIEKKNSKSFLKKAENESYISNVLSFKENIFYLRKTKDRKTQIIKFLNGKRIILLSTGDGVFDGGIVRHIFSFQVSKDEIVRLKIIYDKNGKTYESFIGVDLKGVVTEIFSSSNLLLRNNFSMLGKKIVFLGKQGKNKTSLYLSDGKTYKSLISEQDEDVLKILNFTPKVFGKRICLRLILKGEVPSISCLIREKLEHLVKRGDKVQTDIGSLYLSNIFGHFSFNKESLVFVGSLRSKNNHFKGEGLIKVPLFN